MPYHLYGGDLTSLWSCLRKRNPGMPGLQNANTRPGLAVSAEVLVSSSTFSKTMPYIQPINRPGKLPKTLLCNCYTLRDCSALLEFL